jgi:hypothetical protein
LGGASALPAVMMAPTKITWHRILNAIARLQAKARAEGEKMY